MDNEKPQPPPSITPPAPAPAAGRPRIISPIPIGIHIEYNEMTGAATFQATRDVPFIALVGVFCNILLSLMQQAGAAPNPGLKP